MSDKIYLNACKNKIIKELYVSTADDNYIAARWCQDRDLTVDFYWLVVHALEKYLKASLLSNGRSAIKKHGEKKEYSHDVTKLYDAVAEYASPLLPEYIECSDRIGEDSVFGKEKTVDFIARIYKWGNADNRYNIYGYSQHPGDTYKVDELMFAVRRLCIDLGGYYVPPSEGMSGLKTFDLLKNQPDWWRHWPDLKPERMSSESKVNNLPELREVFLSWNFPFAPTGYDHGSTRIRSNSYNPVIYRHVVEPIKEKFSDGQIDNALELRDWVAENIKLPRKDLDFLRGLKK